MIKRVIISFSEAGHRFFCGCAAVSRHHLDGDAVIRQILCGYFGAVWCGYRNYLAAGTLASASFCEVFFYGFLEVLPKILVSYIIGLGIEFAWAQWKGEEIQEGYLVSGIIIPMIVPVGCPIWMIAIAVAFCI